MTGTWHDCVLALRGDCQQSLQDSQKHGGQVESLGCQITLWPVVAVVQPPPHDHDDDDDDDDDDVDKYCERRGDGGHDACQCCRGVCSMQPRS